MRACVRARACVCVALGILPSLASLALHYFSTLSHKWHDLKKNYWTKNVFFIFPITFVSNIFHSKKNSARWSSMNNGLHVMNPLFLSDFNESWISWKIFEKSLNYQSSRKSIQWELSWSMRSNRRMNTMKLMVPFHNSVNVPKNLTL